MPKSPVNTVLQVEDLCVSYRRDGEWHAAVENLSFRIKRGEAFGLVGESGSGKSSAALAVLRYLPKEARSSARALVFEGQDLARVPSRALRAVRGRHIAAVYQHPGSALNPCLTIGRQIGETLWAHGGLGAAEARERAGGLLARVRVRDPGAVLDLYPHELSGGMQQRATIAMAIALEPALLVLDEPTTALDASIQGEIVAILDDLRRDHGTSLLLISHDIGLIRRATDRVGVMRAGALVEEGNVGTVFDRPSHSYTRDLVASIPGGTAMRRARRVDDAAAATPALKIAKVDQTLGNSRVLHGIDLDIAPGETFGLIGESGSGKSTLARIVTGLLRPTAGSIDLFGQRVAGVVESRSRTERAAVQMVFQSPDATLNPRHRLGRILAQPLRRLGGLRGALLARRTTALLEAVRLPADFARSRPRSLSGGQRQRVAIARAFAGAPRLVVLDEPTSALDVSVQATILHLLNELQRETGAAYLFISHDLHVIRFMADQVGVLYRGYLVEAGPADRVFGGPNHPYTAQLLASVFDAQASREQVPPDQPQGTSESRGCIFVDRCPVALERCSDAPPPTRHDSLGHRIACWHGLDDPGLRPRPPTQSAAQPSRTAAQSPRFSLDRLS